MSTDTPHKITPRHLARTAYLYVRQSSLRQVLENTESTARQYALRQRALALGWRPDAIVVIDCDQGQSGASAADRAGFQQLVREVGLGRAGIVLGLEVSRLARNSADWHRLLEICALTDTLILDEDGLYDPAHFNDRLLLGLKGTMSEAELHVLRARLRGGILNKARRGELAFRLPVGFVYDPAGRVVLDPDLQVQACLRVLFETFHRTGSAWATMKAFRAQGLKFPRRLVRGPRDGALAWRDLDHSLVLHVLHNPRYAGAFVYGRHRARKHPDGHLTIETLPQDQWLVLRKDAHPGYITWAQYEAQRAQLRTSRASHGEDRRNGPPREGPALLQGLLVCGRCGQRMTVRYRARGDELRPTYVCQLETVKQGVPVCQSIPGTHLDDAIGALVVASVTPIALETTLMVQREMQTQVEQTDRLRRQQVERRRYEAELAQRRFLRVDPENRLVAASLEAAWNEALRALHAAQEEYATAQQLDRRVLSPAERERMLALATDLPALWRDPATPARDRKRIVRLILDDVTVTKGAGVLAQVRFKGGTTQTVTVPAAEPAWRLRQTPPAVIAEIDRLLDEQTDDAIITILNAKGLRSGEGRPFTRAMLHHLRKNYALTSRYDRLRARGLLTEAELAARLGVAAPTIKAWRLAGLLKAQPYNDKPEYLYEDPGEHAPAKHKHKFPRRNPVANATHHAPNGRSAV